MGQTTGYADDDIGDDTPSDLAIYDFDESPVGTFPVMAPTRIGVRLKRPWRWLGHFRVIGHRTRYVICWRAFLAGASRLDYGSA